MGSFGDRLRRERGQRGITLDDGALTPKTRAGLLKALEEERFDQLPGGIFNKGFVRAYARHLGIDEDPAGAHYPTPPPGHGRGPGGAPLPPPRRGSPSPPPARRSAGLRARRGRRAPHPAGP